MTSSLSDLEQHLAAALRRQTPAAAAPAGAGGGAPDRAAVAAAIQRRKAAQRARAATDAFSAKLAPVRSLADQTFSRRGTAAAAAARPPPSFRFSSAQGLGCFCLQSSSRDSRISSGTSSRSSARLTHVRATQTFIFATFRTVGCLTSGRAATVTEIRFRSALCSSVVQGIETQACHRVDLGGHGYE
jgi:hypothetical protein